MGVGGGLPPLGQDPQRAGRALLREDVGRIVFGGSTALAISRKTSRRLCLTTEKAKQEEEKRRLQLTMKAPLDLDEIKYTKMKMKSDLDVYAAALEAQASRPSAIEAALAGGDKALFLPSNQATRPELAACLARWRAVAPEVCEQAHKSMAEHEGQSGGFSQKVAQEPSTFRRREDSRASLKRRGTLAGLEMPLQDAIAPMAVCSTSKNPARVLWGQLEDGRNLTPALRSYEGACAAKAAEDFVRSIGPGNDVRYVTSSECRGSDEPKELATVARFLAESALKGSATGRDRQISAARTFRRAAEIENPMAQRHAAMQNTGCPWLVPYAVPPAASTGNARLWRPRPAAPNHTAGNESPQQCIRGAGKPAEHTKMGASSQSTCRRPPVCSCCSQIRVRGHVKVKTCKHTNKVCSLCRKISSGVH